ncbi:hypothetical protein AALP_AAs62963U000100, partial [Arabis alpina]
EFPLSASSQRQSSHSLQARKGRVPTLHTLVSLALHLRATLEDLFQCVFVMATASAKPKNIMARPCVRMQNKFSSSLGKVSIDEEREHLDAALGDNSFDGIVNEKGETLWLIRLRLFYGIREWEIVIC